jgi:hypothetical protein
MVIIIISGCAKKITYFHTEEPQKRSCNYAPIKTQSTLPEPVGEWVVHVELIKATKYIPAPYIPNSGNQYGLAIDFLYPSDKDQVMYKSLFESVEDQRDFLYRASIVYGFDSTWYSDTSYCFNIDSAVLECLPECVKVTATQTSRFYFDYSELPLYPYWIYPGYPRSEKCGWGQIYMGTTEDYGGGVYTERPSIQFEYFDLPKDTDSVRVSFDVTMLDKNKNTEITKHYSIVLHKYVGRLDY